MEKRKIFLPMIESIEYKKLARTYSKERLMLEGSGSAIFITAPSHSSGQCLVSSWFPHVIERSGSQTDDKKATKMASRTESGAFSSACHYFEPTTLGGGRAKRQSWANRHNPGRVDMGMTHVVMTFDVINIHRGRNARK